MFSKTFPGYHQFSSESKTPCFVTIFIHDIAPFPPCFTCTCIASLLYSRGFPNGLSSPPTTIPGWQSCFSYHLFSLASNLKQCCISYFLFFFKTEAGVQLLGSKTYCRSKAPLLQIIELPKNCVVIFYKPTILAFF